MTLQENLLINHIIGAIEREEDKGNKCTDKYILGQINRSTSQLINTIGLEVEKIDFDEVQRVIAEYFGIVVED